MKKWGRLLCISSGRWRCSQWPNTRRHGSSAQLSQRTHYKHIIIIINVSYQPSTRTIIDRCSAITESTSLSFSSFLSPIHMLHYNSNSNSALITRVTAVVGAFSRSSLECVIYLYIIYALKRVQIQKCVCASSRALYITRLECRTYMNIVARPASSLYIYCGIEWRFARASSSSSAFVDHSLHLSLYAREFWRPPLEAYMLSRVESTDTRFVLTRVGYNCECGIDETSASRLLHLCDRSANLL